MRSIAKRAGQNRDWMHQLVREMLMHRLASQPAIRSMLPQLEADVEAARITPVRCRAPDSRAFLIPTAPLVFAAQKRENRGYTQRSDIPHEQPEPRPSRCHPQRKHR